MLKNNWIPQHGFDYVTRSTTERNAHTMRRDFTQETSIAKVINHLFSELKPLHSLRKNYKRAFMYMGLYLKKKKKNLNFTIKAVQFSLVIFKHPRLSKMFRIWSLCFSANSKSFTSWAGVTFKAPRNKNYYFNTHQQSN